MKYCTLSLCCLVNDDMHVKLWGDKGLHGKDLRLFWPILQCLNCITFQACDVLLPLHDFMQLNPGGFLSVVLPSLTSHLRLVRC